MPTLNQELMYLILHFLEQENFTESVHRLEKESGVFFNTKYFDEKLTAGEWDELENYLSGFTKLDDNEYSTKIFFEIRKQKYLEALDRKDRSKALEILVQDLGVFSTSEKELYNEMTQLLTLQNFRENTKLATYRYLDTNTARSLMLVEVKKLIAANPLFRDKLMFPTFESSRLQTLINQSFNWQHQHCNNPKPNPVYETIFIDHTCRRGRGRPQAPRPVNQAVAPWTKPTAYGPLPPGAAVATANAGALASWMATASGAYNIQDALATPFSMSLPQNQASILKQPRTPPATPSIVDYQNPDPSEEMTYLASRWPEDLPLKAAVAVHQGPTVTSMEFHPMQNTLLLVGSVTGEITLWELTVQQRLVSSPFQIWDMSKCSSQFQASIAKETSITVTRVAWSPDGNFIGVAYTKHLIHLYTFSGTNHLRQHSEIDAHMGAVNDLAFTNRNKQLYVVTCGDDKLIKVWDVSGQMHFIFEGHDAPVYSICPHQKDNVQFIFSTAIDGKIKAWLYNNMGSRDFNSPNDCLTTMLYSADGTRLFSCGTSKDGDSFLVEWNVKEGLIKRTYLGLQKKSAGVVQFDTSKNRFLAVGEDGKIMFWKVDNINVLTSTDAEGGLPARPRLRFNREGNLLAVTTADNGIKILANLAGLQSLIAMKSLSGKIPVDSSVINAIAVDPSKSKPWQLAEILDPAQCRQATLMDTAGSSTKVVGLLYTNSGAGILALDLNGIQRLWKWVCSEENPCGIVTAAVVPQHMKPESGLYMTNDISGVNLEEASPCVALSKNGAYVMSAVGGKVSLFNLLNFNLMERFIAPPPASTFLAFHPKDNNIIANGMDDSTILIYNVRMDEVKFKLKGHQKRITGLAFSSTLNLLVSSGADAQISFWSIDTWEKRKSVAVEMPANGGDTRVQFHMDQIHILAVRETQLAIFDGSKMESIRQWIPQVPLSSPISSAVYASNSELIYTAFRDGNIGVFDADTLRLRCRISPSAYFPQGRQGLSPLVVAANPQYQNQFAVGLNDGSVKVIEPREGKWGHEQTKMASTM